jgi:hypothetical protein
MINFYCFFNEFLPLNPLKGTLTSEKTETIKIFYTPKSPLGDLGVKSEGQM